MNPVEGLAGVWGARGWLRSKELEAELGELEPKPLTGLFCLLKRSPPFKPKCPQIQVASPAIEGVLQEVHLLHSLLN